MPYYHVIILFISKSTGRANRQIIYDCDAEKVEKDIVQPMKDGKAFFAGDAVVYPELIEKFGIYRTEKTLEQIIIDRTRPQSTANLYFSPHIALMDLTTELELRKLGQCVTSDFLRTLSNKEMNEESSNTQPDIAKLSSFLGIDKNWMTSTNALQLQEVAVVLVARKKE